jgi:hypothetical protein
MKLHRRAVALWPLLFAGPAFAGPADSAELVRRPFVYGRQYGFLRSGRAQMILQADRVDVGPAFTYLLFDIEDARQSRRKDGAFNFDPARALEPSALVVELGGFAFTALGHRTSVEWAWCDGIPAIQATWWAGGLRVTEQVRPDGSAGWFVRRVILESANLVGEEAFTLRLGLPGSPARREDSAGASPRLVWDGPGVRVTLAAEGGWPLQLDPAQAGMRIGPLTIVPGERVVVNTQLGVAIHPSGAPGPAASASSPADPRAGGPHALARAWAVTSSVETADRTVAGLFDHARFALDGMIGEDGTMNAGVFEYGAQWVRDTSNTVLGAIHAGHFELARGGLHRILSQMVSRDGVTMIANQFEQPDLEQFDQMGELMHVLKAWRDWTGDDSLIREHRALLTAMVERPLLPRFRDEAGMVHNRREFWERTFRDACELAYQTWVIQGLRDAADLAGALEASGRAPRWRAEADRIREAVLAHPTRALVDQGRLIKRRNVTGEPAGDAADFPGFQADVPLRSERAHRIHPDASIALPLALGIVDPRSELARATLDDLEGLWNARWSDGGYDRYHTSSQPDQPGPWPFATCFILRAQHEAGQLDRSRRSLEWLNAVQGGALGAWFEEIPSIRSTQSTCGIVPWTSAEVTLFVVRHWLGVGFDGDALVLRPKLFAGSPPVSADLRFRTGRLRLQVSGAGPIRSATLAGTGPLLVAKDGSVRLPRDFGGGTVVLQAAP